MAYTPFNSSKPDATTENGTQFATSTRANLVAIRDAAIMGGGFFGWPLAISGGTAEQPTTFIYSSGTERVKAVVTWGVSGGATGNPQTVAYTYSSNSGGLYEAIGTKTITYDTNGNVTATSWA